MCVSGGTAHEAETKIGFATGMLLDRCKKFGMTPNLSRGKTEILFHFRGPGSRAKKQAHFGGAASGTLPVLCEAGVAHIPVTGDYTHLGNIIHHTGQNHKEMRRRVAIAHQAYGTHRRCIYRNQCIETGRRGELFESLVLSKLLYGAETWVPDTIASSSQFHAGVVGLFKRLGGIRHDAHLRDDEVLCATNMLSPTELLRRQRLRYVTTLYACKDIVPWSLLAEDQEWCDLLRSDFLWMYAQLEHASSLPDPSWNFEPWHQIIVHYPGYWKRLVRRACRHAVLQRQKECHARQLHAEVIDILRHHGSLACDPPKPKSQRPADKYGCLTCGVSCRNKAGERAHMFRCHSQVASHRRFCAGTQCGACLKEFHSVGRLSQHLRLQQRCRDVLRGYRIGPAREPGIGSTIHAEQERHHNRLLSAQQAHGPLREERPVLPEEPDVHDACFNAASEFLLECNGDQLEEFLRDLPSEHAISWSQFCLTFSTLCRGLSQEEWRLCKAPQGELEAAFRRVQDPTTWSMFTSPTWSSSGESHLDLYDYETWMIRLCEADGPWVELPRLPCHGFRERIFLHVYSGRRRRGDLQEFLERYYVPRDGEVLHVVSIDIIVDELYGDVRSKGTKTFWLDGIKQGFVTAMLAGPPCNTFSAARANKVQGHAGHGGPRVVRDREHAWGYPSLTLRELEDVGVGNDLLGFAIVAFLLLFFTRGSGLIEHPDEPSDQDAVSIWRLPIIHLIRCLPGVHLHRVLQGLFGSETAKPTGLLTLNLAEFTHTMHSWRLAGNPPKGGSIGLSERGEFKTARLKEYPPAFCAGIAQSFIAAFDQQEACLDGVPAEFLQKCKDLVHTEYGQYLGKDYAG